jgi:uncharacterized protein
VSFWEGALLVLGGAAAGIVNAMAGGGSSLTVPLLVLAGVPGNEANGSNRVGILAQGITTAWSFHDQGVTAYREARAVLLPVVLGSLVGAYGVSQLTDETFEKGFAILMLPVIFLSIRQPKPRVDAEPWHPAVTFLVFLAIGVYGGAVQAGVGLVLLAALTRSGIDLVTANVIKVIVTIGVTAMALPVFIAQGKVRWGPAIVLAVGLAIGGWIGARIAVRGGERIIRVVMVVAALGLAGRLLGLY